MWGSLFSTGTRGSSRRWSSTSVLSIWRSNRNSPRTTPRPESVSTSERRSEVAHKPRDRPLGLWLDAEAVGVAREALALGGDVEPVLGRGITVHAVLALRVLPNEAPHAVGGLAGELDPEVAIDALHGLQGVGQKLPEVHVVETLGRETAGVAHGRGAVEREREARRPVRGDL